MTLKYLLLFLTVDITPEPTPPATGVDCTESALTVYIPRSLIGTVDGSHLHFLDDSCVGTNHNNTHVELSTAYGTCGTIMEVSYGEIAQNTRHMPDATLYIAIFSKHRTLTKKARHISAWRNDMM